MKVASIFFVLFCLIFILRIQPLKNYFRPQNHFIQDTLKVDTVDAQVYFDQLFDSTISDSAFMTALRNFNKKLPDSAESTINWHSGQSDIVDSYMGLDFIARNITTWMNSTNDVHHTSELIYKNKIIRSHSWTDFGRPMHSGRPVVKSDTAGNSGSYVSRKDSYYNYKLKMIVELSLTSKCKNVIRFSEGMQAWSEPPCVLVKMTRHYSSFDKAYVPEVWTKEN